MKKTLSLILVAVLTITAITVLLVPSVSAADAPVEIEVTWELGYIGGNNQSDATRRQAFYGAGTYYSTSSYFTVEKAGTTVAFSDKNDSFGGADTNYASASAFVFSVWSTTDNTTYTFVKGGTGGTSPNNANDPLCVYFDNPTGFRTYEYTTESDNEIIRVCFRSGQKADSDISTANFPKVYSVVKDPSEITTVALTTAAPVTTAKPVVTTKTPATTTKAPVATTVATTTATPSADTTAAAKAEKGGCGASTIIPLIALLSAATCVAFVGVKKK